jgi:hypothetical protein
MKTQKTKTKSQQKPAPAYDRAIVTLKKEPKEKGELPEQAAAILAALKPKGSLTVGELKAAMKAKIESVQTMSRLWVFYRARLIEGGFITMKGGR